MMISLCKLCCMNLMLKCANTHDIPRVRVCMYVILTQHQFWTIWT